MHATLRLVSLSALALTRCQQDAVFPAFQPNELVSDNRVLGDWKAGSDRWQVTPGTGYGYRMRVTSGSDTTWWWLHLARHDKLLLADVQRDVEGDGDALLPLHEYAVVQRLDSVVVYAYPSEDWLKEYLPQHPRELPYLATGDGLLITASPAQISGFLARHRDEPQAWSTADTMWRATTRE
jgi:hypothetical protein